MKLTFAPPVRQEPAQPKLPAFPPAVHPTPAAIAAHAVTCWHLLCDARKEIAPIVVEHDYVMAQLADPALADHPMRGWGERRARKLTESLAVGINVLLGHLHGLETAWMALTPYDREQTMLHQVIGMDAATDCIGPVLAFATFPADWEPPPDVIATLPYELLLTAGISPF